MTKPSDNMNRLEFIKENAQKMTTIEIAQRLNIAPNTVRKLASQIEICLRSHNAVITVNYPCDKCGTFERYKKSRICVACKKAANKYQRGKLNEPQICNQYYDLTPFYNAAKSVIRLNGVF